MAIDVERRRPKLGNVTGGLSGPAIRPVAVRMVWQVAAAGLGVPIIGMGGIMSAADALSSSPGRGHGGGRRYGDIRDAGHLPASH